MKDLMILLVVNLASISCVIIAGILAYNESMFFLFFLVFAILTHAVPTKQTTIRRP